MVSPTLDTSSSAQHTSAPLVEKREGGGQCDQEQPATKGQERNSVSGPHLGVRQGFLAVCSFPGVSPLSSNAIQQQWIHSEKGALFSHYYT